MIKITETKITGVNKNTHKELVIKFVIKPEDYTTEQEDMFYDLKNNGTLGAFIFQGTEFTEDTGKSEKDIKNKLLQNLVFFISKYAEKSNCDVEKLKQDIYNKYGVISSKELSIDVLKKEVENLKAGILYD